MASSTSAPAISAARKAAIRSEATWASASPSATASAALIRSPVMAIHMPVAPGSVSNAWVAPTSGRSRCRPRHGKQVPAAGNAVRPVQRHADPAAHDDAVDQRDIGLGIVPDAHIELVLLPPPERSHAGKIPGLALIMQRADVATGAEGPVAPRLPQ